MQRNQLVCIPRKQNCLYGFFFCPLTSFIADWSSLFSVLHFTELTDPLQFFILWPLKLVWHPFYQHSTAWHCLIFLVGSRFSWIFNTLQSDSGSVVRSWNCMYLIRLLLATYVSNDDVLSETNPTNLLRKVFNLRHFWYLELCRIKIAYISDEILNDAYNGDYTCRVS